MFTMNVMQVLICVLITQKTDLSDFDHVDYEKNIYFYMCMAISIMNFFFCIFKYNKRSKFTRIKGDLFKDESFLNNRSYALRYYLELIFVLIHPSKFLFKYSISFMDKDSSALI